MKNTLLPTIVRIVRHEGEPMAYVVDAAEFREFVLSSGIDVAIDEEDYLAQNADVAREVVAGNLPSGSHHFKVFGYFEGRGAKFIRRETD